MRACIAAIALALLGGCATSTGTGVVGINRTQLFMVSAAQVNDLAAERYSRGLAVASEAGKLNVNAAQTARVREIADRMTREVAAFRSDAVNWKWEVNVLDSEDLQAACWPGGKIIVYSGLINRLALSDDELAAVLGHEISHALREHSREKASQDVLAKSVVNAIAQSNTRYAKAKGDLAAIGSALFVQLPFSREMEFEADVMGLELAARAGYDPNAAPNIWRKMMQETGRGGATDFFNTHPDPERRIVALEATAPKVQSLYLASLERNPTRTAAAALALSATKAAGSVAASGASQAWEEIGSFEGATVTVQSEVNTGVMRKAWVKQSYPQPGYSKSQTGSAQWTTTSMFVVNCEEKRSLMQNVATDSMYGSRVFVAIGDPLLHVDQSQMTVPASGTAAAAVLQLICSRGGVKSPVSSSEPLRG